jgi:hypothetical protein
LYYRIGSVNWEWVTTGPGIGFTLGALAGLAAYGVGNILVGPRAEKIAKLSQEIQANGGSRSSQQMEQLMQLQKQLDFGGKLDFALITIAVLAMSTARYWQF